jgi:integrase/recombinase XerD
MPINLPTMLKKLEEVSKTSGNQTILKEFYQYQRSKDLKSERHTINLLLLLISLDKFLIANAGQPLAFTSINSKEQVITFLNHRYVKGKGWVEREKDADGRYITTFNLHLGLLRIFFRWLLCKDKQDFGEWETPPFLKIKNKKPLRESPYGVNDIWQLHDVLTIVGYEPELRNQAIITLLWDLDARPHEITALRIKDIVLNEQYGEGTIPSNTKTGGGPILLTSSFTYVRDWINKHPFKNEPDARLICNLHTGAPVMPDTVWQVLKQLRLRIKRFIISKKENGSFAFANTDEQQKQRHKLELLQNLLREKKWNPYCFRHSAITDDSDHLPEYALKKKVRWVMDSQQGRRYIKNRMGDELKHRILERAGIKIENKQPHMVSRTCGRCGYVNKLENKYCEGKGCNYPLTQLALDEIKATEEAKFQALRNEMAQSKQEIKDRFEVYESKMAEFVHDIKSELNYEERSNSISKLVMDKMTEILDRVAPDWFQEVYGPNAQRLTPKAHEKIKEWLKILTTQIDAENRERDLELQKQKKVLIDSIGTNV